MHNITNERHNGHPFSVARLVLTGLAFCGCLAMTRAAVSSPSVMPLSGEGFTSETVISATNTTLMVKLAPTMSPWFATKMTDLTVGTPLGLAFVYPEKFPPLGRDERASWLNFYPLVTYADPMQYSSYQSYHKDRDGRWVSDDPFNRGKERFAGAGSTPTQSVISSDLAKQGLQEQGRTWCPWNELGPMQVGPEGKTVFVTGQIAAPTITVAARVPYTLGYLQAYLQRLQATHSPGVTIDTPGKTAGGHSLCIIRLESPDSIGRPTSKRPTILLYAREHATEPDGSWVLDGVIRWLLSDETAAKTARRQVNWLVIPILDLDGAASATCHSGDIFSDAKPILPEAVDYARYLVKWVDSGRSISAVVNLHTGVLGEDTNLECAMLPLTQRKSIQAFNERLFNTARSVGFTTGAPVGLSEGIMSARLAGWCASKFASAELDYEVNSRAINRGSLPQLRALGEVFGKQLSYWVTSKDFTPCYEAQRQLQELRVAKQTAWWKQMGHDAHHRTPYDLFVMGY